VTLDAVVPKAGQKPLTPGQQDALSRMPPIEESKFPTTYASMPASLYTDPEQFEKEKQAIFRRQPVLVGLTAMIPTPNMYFQCSVLGMPVLVTRTRDGKVNAFVNVCTHRGAKLCATDTPKEGGRISCPYHAWTFGLDGKLVGIPRQELFEGIDKTGLNLTPLPCSEAGGLIWVGLDPEYALDFASVEGDLAADLDALGLPQMRLFDNAVFEVKANWKLVMDTMNDSYHVTRLHKDSLARFFVDAQNIIDPIGPHLRVAAHRGNFDKAARFENFSQASEMMLFAYTLFPNAVVVPSPGFISVGIMEPVTAGTTRVHYYMLAYDTLADAKLERSFKLMETVFGTEDYWAAEQCQEGLSAGTLKQVHFGGMEIQIPFFHDQIRQCVESKQS
jgi:phenylpropionate dioxygenase-like ring-hydroxylating dioxygenase large terminal subunit